MSQVPADTPPSSGRDSRPIPTDWGHNYVDVGAMAWQQSPTPGSRQKVLYDDPTTGRRTVLFDVAPGATIALHEHPDIEQTFILEGRLVDHMGECTAGNFVWRSPGSRHTAHCPDGARYIVFFMKPIKRL